MVPRGHRRPRSRHAGSTCRRRPSTCRAIVALDRGADRGGARVRGRRRRLLPGRALPRLRAALGPQPDQVERAGAEPAQGGRARLRALEGEQAEARTRRGTRRGATAGPAGTSSARRWPRRSSGPRSRSTAAGSTSSSRTTRTRSRSRARSAIRSPRSGCTTACSASPARRCRSRSGTCDDPRGARRMGPRGGARLLPHGVTGASRSTSRRRRWRRPRPRRETLRNAFTLRGRGARRGGWDDFAGALDDDFDTPAALAVLHDWASTGQLELLRRGLAGLRSRVARASATTRRRRSSSWPSAAARPARRATSRPSDRLRDELGRARLGDARRARRRPRPSCGVTPDLVYGRRAVREALRGQRQVLEVWATERALKAEPWLAEARPRAKAGPRADRARRDARPPGRRSRGSSRSATPTPTSSLRPSGRCSRCSTASPTRATSAPSAAARRAPARRASSSRRTARRSSRRPSRARRPARSSICRSRS